MILFIREWLQKVNSLSSKTTDIMKTHHQKAGQLISCHRLIVQNIYYTDMFESPEIVHCVKTERVTIFKTPPVSTTKGFYLDDWKEMIWEGGVKVVEKNKVITVTFVGKDGKVFAQTKVPQDPSEAIKKTIDSSRGYGVRLQRPNGAGYLWIGVAFRDRNDAFDFGVVFQDYNSRKNLDVKALEKQFSGKDDFSLKKGQKIKINIGKKTETPSDGFFNEFNADEAPEPKKKEEKKPASEDWFADFGAPEKKPEQAKKEPSKSDFNLLDL